MSPSVSPAGGVKLTIGDCLLVAEEVEPRILAVLPAALIHFPRSFLDYHEMPKVLRAIIDAILAGKEDGPGLGMIEFVELRRWAYASLKDGRAKPLAERKVRRTYRLKPRVAELLAEKASAGHTTETAIIESLVESTLSGGE